MKRRGFLGFMGGAAVAGPQLAKAAVAELPSGLGNAVPGVIGGYGSLGQPIASGSDKTWKLKEIANLKRLISGGLTDDEKEDRKRRRLYQQERIISQSVACLVSVSGTRKLEIYRDRMEQHNEKIQISEAKGRLHWLLRDDT